VGSRAVSDAMLERKIPSLRQKSNPRTPIVQLIAQRVPGEKRLRVADHSPPSSAEVKNALGCCPAWQRDKRSLMYSRESLHDDVCLKIMRFFAKVIIYGK
jgi:hypothetical protein